MNTVLWIALFTGLLSCMQGSETWNPINCLDSRTTCAVDSHCQMMLSALPQVCPSIPETCDVKRRQDCQAVQRWLQLTPVFRNCHCNLSGRLLQQCQMLKASIHTDPCPHVVPEPEVKMNTTNTRKQPERSPVSESKYARRRSKEKYYIPDNDVDNGDDIVYYDEYDSETSENYNEAQEDISCIGVRKNCLTDQSFPDCGQILHDYRKLCKENKKRNECVANDLEGCFNVLHKLKPSGIYECNCNKIDRDRKDTFQKCERIQYRLANNTCLVTVPYLIHSVKNVATSYEVLRNIVSAPSNMPVDQSGSCIDAFHACDGDYNCRNKMATYLSSCHWNVRIRHCSRDSCLQDIRQFYLHVKPQLSHALLFCQCLPGDYKCKAIRQALYPTCSTVEMPPPACHRLLDRCELDPTCRQRWYDYEDYCRYDKITNGCASGPSMCRSAQEGIMGTILTANCTCAFLDGMEAAKCKQAALRLQEDSVCKDLATIDFQKNHLPTAAPSSPWRDTQQIETLPRADCMRHQFDHKIPPFMSVPTFIRMYRNDSDCSDLCECRTEGHSMSCRRLPCPPPQNCREEQPVSKLSLTHGSGFVRPDRGQCRCIKGEVVCARPLKSPYKQPTGLFLHVGYSVSDRELLEGHSNLIFDLNSVNSKLGALLNGDPAEQFCKIAIYHHEDGNIVFEVKLTPYRQNQDLRKMCESPTQHVSYMINHRQSVIVTDAELSILKVAEMELLQRISGPQASSDEPQHRSGSGVITAHPLLLLWILMTIWIIH